MEAMAKKMRTPTAEEVQQDRKREGQAWARSFLAHGPCGEAMYQYRWPRSMTKSSSWRGPTLWCPWVSTSAATSQNLCSIVIGQTRN